jgi:hypothetical protein
MQPMSIGFGSREEVALTKKYSKPFFLIKSCDKITVPAVRACMSYRNYRVFVSV